MLWFCDLLILNKDSVLIAVKRDAIFYTRDVKVVPFVRGRYMRKGYHFSQKWYRKGSGVEPRGDQIDRLRSYFNLLHIFATLISFLQEIKFFPRPQGWA